MPSFSVGAAYRVPGTFTSKLRLQANILCIERVTIVVDSFTVDSKSINLRAESGTLIDTVPTAAQMQYGHDCTIADGAYVTIGSVLIPMRLFFRRVNGVQWHLAVRLPA